MNLFVSSASNKSEAFSYMMNHFCKSDGSTLLSYDSKMWLFERKDNVVSIRPIHGFVVGLVYEDTRPKEPNWTRYVAGLTWKHGGESPREFYSFWGAMTLATADVFYDLHELSCLLDQLKHQIHNFDFGKDVFIVPVTVTAGRAS